MKIFYVTKKQVNEWITHSLQNSNVDELQNETIRVLKDLSKFPQENKWQIKFYLKVLEILIIKYE